MIRHGGAPQGPSVCPGADRSGHAGPGRAPPLPIPARQPSPGWSGMFLHARPVGPGLTHPLPQRRRDRSGNRLSSCRRDRRAPGAQSPRPQPRRRGRGRAAITPPLITNRRLRARRLYPASTGKNGLRKRRPLLSSVSPGWRRRRRKKVDRDGGRRCISRMVGHVPDGGFPTLGGYYRQRVNSCVRGIPKCSSRRTWFQSRIPTCRGIPKCSSAEMGVHGGVLQ